MRQPVVLFWMAATEVDLGTVRDHGQGATFRIVKCGMRELTAQAIAAAACGPVMAVVDDDRTATEVLGVGVDEVVRQSELTDDGIQRAVTRAEARSRGRLLALAPDRPLPDETGALAVLLDWIAVELAGCVSGAVLDSELLDEGVKGLISSSEPGRGAPEREPARESCVSNDDVVEMLDTVKGSIRQTLEVLNALRGLSGSDASITSVPRVLGALTRVLRSRAIPFADIRVEADEPCDTTVSTSKLVAALVVLVSSALDRAGRAPQGHRAQITLRAFMAEGSAFLEIEDNVAEASPGEGTVTLRSDPITRIGITLRALGGDLLVEAGGGGTTTRLVLPIFEGRAVTTDDARVTPTASSSRAN